MIPCCRNALLDPSPPGSERYSSMPRLSRTMYVCLHEQDSLIGTRVCMQAQGERQTLSQSQQGQCLHHAKRDSMRTGRRRGTRLLCWPRWTTSTSSSITTASLRSAGAFRSSWSSARCACACRSSGVRRDAWPSGVGFWRISANYLGATLLSTGSSQLLIKWVMHTNGTRPLSSNTAPRFVKSQRQSSGALSRSARRRRATWAGT